MIWDKDNGIWNCELKKNLLKIMFIVHKRKAIFWKLIVELECDTSDVRNKWYYLVINNRWIIFVFVWISQSIYRSIDLSIKNSTEKWEESTFIWTIVVSRKKWQKMRLKHMVKQVPIGVLNRTEWNLSRKIKLFTQYRWAIKLLNCSIWRFNLNSDNFKQIFCWAWYKQRNSFAVTIISCSITYRVECFLFE